MGHYANDPEKESREETNEKNFWNAQRKVYAKVRKPIKYDGRVFSSRRVFATFLGVQESVIKKVIDKGSYKGIEIIQMKKEKS